VRDISPEHSLTLTGNQMAAFPMKVAGLTGMFWARLAADLLAGGIGIVVVLWGFGRAVPLAAPVAGTSG